MTDTNGINAVFGKPTSGLIGPFAFPFEWTFQRSRSGRKSSRKPFHRLPSIKGMPLFIEAVPPPVKQLREMLRELGAAVHIHAHDIGE